ncbi:MAG: dihydrofolate reductase [Firmicutes bacterium]|nr:dihydrofolate reductase [Bacillota bacterium]
MNAIVVVDRNWAIGKDGNLLVHLPGDLKYYKEKTIGNVIVYGRKTLSTYPGGKPLPGRTNIVLTRNAGYENEDCIICHSRDEVLERVKAFDDEKVFISGGAEIYQLFFDDVDTFYVTKIDEEYEADRHFPDLDKLGFKVVWESEEQEHKGTKYRFLKYVRDDNR